MNVLPMEIKAAIQIAKPAGEVFEAIVDPVKMSNYFISHGSGRMEAEKELLWQFPEFEGEHPVRVGKIVKGSYISFYWNNKDTEQLVEMHLVAARNDDNATVVTVTEKTVKGEPAIEWLKGNTEGWANFLACLKAWLEFGINLRKGAFDYMRK